MKRRAFLLTIFVFLITVSSLSALAVVYDAGDIDESCAVDVNDFALLAAAWHTDPNYSAFDPNCDINLPQPDEYIDTLDLLVLVDDWLLSDEVKWAEGKAFMLIIDQAILDYVAANPDVPIGGMPPTLVDIGLTPADITGEFFTVADFSWVVIYSPPDLVYIITSVAPVGICSPAVVQLNYDSNEEPPRWWIEGGGGP